MFDFRYHVALARGRLPRPRDRDPRRRRDLRPGLRRRRRARRLQRDGSPSSTDRSSAATIARTSSSGARRRPRPSSRARIRLLVAGPARGQRRVAVARASAPSTARRRGSNALVERGGGDRRAEACDRALRRAEALDSDGSVAPASPSYVGASKLDDLGRELGRELVDGGETPLWDALDAGARRGARRQASTLRRTPSWSSRTAEPQQGDTARFLAGLYGGLASSSVPAVGVEPTRRCSRARFRRSRATASRPSTRRHRRSAGSRSCCSSPARRRGDYGVDETADDGILPPIEPVAAPAPVA